MDNLDAIRARHNKPVDLVDSYSYSLLVDDVGKLLAKIDADAELIARLRKQRDSVHELNNDVYEVLEEAQVEVLDLKVQLAEGREIVEGQRGVLKNLGYPAERDKQANEWLKKVGE